MRVVHIKKEPYSVYIGRPSVFGNPFTLDKYTRTEAVSNYETYARQHSEVLEAILELSEDAVLGCWCAPRLCHGDIIIKLWREMHGSIE